VATFEASPRFARDLRRLTKAQRAPAQTAARELAADLNAKVRFRPSLRVKRVRSAPPGVFEMTWAPDGRATFEFGREVRIGHAHVVWRRIGTHAILDDA
jgi:hypothetical protein